VRHGDAWRVCVDVGWPCVSAWHRVGRAVTRALVVSAAGTSSGSELVANCPCPYVVSFYDAFVDQGEGTLNFVMEYMDGGSLEVGSAVAAPTVLYSA
jgi:serine/threonine protein kinase